MSTAEQLAFKAAMRLMTHADIPGGSLWDVTTVREKSLMLKAWYAARAVTAQPAQAPAQAAEPVAWLYQHKTEPARAACVVKRMDSKLAGASDYWEMPLYAAPHPSEPAATGRVGLTVEQAIKLWHENAEAHRRESAFEWFAAGIIAAERAHGVATTGSAAPTGEA